MIKKPGYPKGAPRTHLRKKVTSPGNYYTFVYKYERERESKSRANFTIYRRIIVLILSYLHDK